MGGKSVMHNNPNPFTGNEPRMGFSVIGSRMSGGANSGSSSKNTLERIEERLIKLEGLLGITDEESDSDDIMGSDSLSDLLFGMV